MPKFGSYTELALGGVDSTADFIIISDGGAATKKVSPTTLLTSAIKGTTGGFKRYYSSATVNIAAAASATIEVNIPASSRILGCQLRVDAALTAGELWDAAYSGGSTGAICAAQAVAQNTKVNSLTTDTITSEADIVITKNGGGNFTAAGTIRAIVYFETFDAMASL
jgi:hypothetical protein